MLMTITIYVRAQWQVGLTGGYSVNTLSTDTHYAYNLNYESRGGLTIGVPVIYSFNDWFTLRADALFVQKNYKMHRSGYFAGFHSEWSNNYLSLPIVAQFSFGGKRLRGFVNGGGYLGYWLSSYQKGNTANYDNTIKEDNTYLNEANTIAYNEKVMVPLCLYV